MPRSDERERLIEAAARDPSADHKLVLADWLEEHDEAPLAYAYRWAAHRGRHPLCARKFVYWDGRGHNLGKKHQLGTSALPVLIFEMLSGKNRNRHLESYRGSYWSRPRIETKAWSSFAEAFTALSEALFLLQQEVALVPLSMPISKRARAAEQALAKLTPQERKLLLGRLRT